MRALGYMLLTAIVGRVFFASMWLVFCLAVLVGLILWSAFRHKGGEEAKPHHEEPYAPTRTPARVELPVQHVVVRHIHTIDRSAEWPEEITVDESGVTRRPMHPLARREQERRRPLPPMFGNN